MKYAIRVQFRSQEGVWSKAYTYLSASPYDVHEDVVVPTSNYYGVGRVKECISSEELDPTIAYKVALGRIPRGE